MTDLITEDEGDGLIRFRGSGSMNVDGFGVRSFSGVFASRDMVEIIEDQPGGCRWVCHQAVVVDESVWLHTGVITDVSTGRLLSSWGEMTWSVLR